ncbi:MAG TPA: hypothetical protein VLA82_13480 [Actinomycetota bacterium]|nr:hypothetical protein [Actinomycetota bacterium]
MRARAVRSLLVTFLVGSTWLVFSAQESLACSCALGEPRDALRRADAAFVGTLMERSEGGPSVPYYGGEVATFRFLVADDIKGNLDDEIEVVTSSSGASCGLELAEGARVGLFLMLTDEGVWTSGLCSQIGPAALLRASAPLPEPKGVGPVRLIVGGSFGEARVMALDGRGRTLAYGAGEGDVFDIDVCPGQERMVESVSHGRIGSLVVRDVDTLAIVRQVRVVEARFPSVYLVDCVDRDGERLVAVDDLQGNVRIHVIDGTHLETVFEGPGRSWGSALGPGYAEVVIRGGEFGRVDLETGQLQSIVQLPPHASAARLSPDGRWVAAVRYGGALPDEPPSDIVLIPVDGGAPVSHPLEFWNDSGRVAWQPDGRLLFLPAGEDVERIAIFDIPSFDEVVGADGWYFTETAVVDGVTYGVSGRQLAAVELGVDDASRTLRTFDGDAYAIAAVTGRVIADPSPVPEPSEAPVQAAPIATAGSGWVPFGVGAMTLAAVAVALALRSRTRLTGPRQPTDIA